MSFKSQYYSLDENFNNYNIITDDNKPNIEYYVSEKKHTNTIGNSNKKGPVNTFPLGWTCYKKDNRWVCPMRGDKS